MGGFHKVLSESPASRPQELEPESAPLKHHWGSPREKFTQLTANMEYLYPQPRAGPTPTYLLPEDIFGVVRNDWVLLAM